MSIVNCPFSKGLAPANQKKSWRSTLLPLFEQNQILKGCYYDDYESGRCPYSLHFASTYEWRLSGRKTNSLHSYNVLSINLIGGIFRQIVEAGPECHTILSLTFSPPRKKHSRPIEPPFTYYTRSLTRMYVQPFTYIRVSPYVRTCSAQPPLEGA